MACLLALAAAAIRSTRPPAMPYAPNSVIAASSRRRLVSCESQGMPGDYNQLVGLTSGLHHAWIVATVSRFAFRTAALALPGIRARPEPAVHRLASSLH